jgi:hypothetical protein
MPPSIAQKSNAKKGGRDNNARRSGSRNTTPGVTQRPVEMDTPLTEVRMKPFSISSYDEIVEQQSGSGIPDSKSLDALIDRIENLLKEVEARGNASDRGMRRLAGLRKDRLEELEAERRDEEQRERLKREAAEEEERERKANKMKKKKETSRATEERPLAHGAHGLAPQDGSNLGMFVLCFHTVSLSLQSQRHCFGRFAAVINHDPSRQSLVRIKILQLVGLEGPAASKFPIWSCAFMFCSRTMVVIMSILVGIVFVDAITLSYILSRSLMLD